MERPMSHQKAWLFPIRSTIWTLHLQTMTDHIEKRFLNRFPVGMPDTTLCTQTFPPVCLAGLQHLKELSHPYTFVDRDAVYFDPSMGPERNLSSTDNHPCPNASRTQQAS